MFSQFFIDRPIFSWVVTLLIMGAGAIAIPSLPIQQYPVIAPPEVTISATYPGASAETLDKTVTQIIEQNLRGIDNLRYFTSESSSSGNATIRLTFETGTNPDIAQIQTQNKLSQSLPRLPSQVQQLGIQVEKSSSTFGLVAAFYSKSGKIHQDDIGDYITSNLVEPIARVNGVGQINPFAPQHSLRVWLNPEKLFYYKITSLEVMAAIRDQNGQLAAGQIGAGPSIEGQQINSSIIAQTLLTSPEQFRNIVLRTLPDGSTVKLGDVARVEVGAENYLSIRRFNGKGAAGFGVSLSTDANALETIQAVKDTVESFRATFPGDVDVSYPVDVSPFIKISVTEVVETLIIAVILVVLVMFIFLQDWRSTLVPGIAIPVVLLGTFASLVALGYSINILTLFALVLSIGMLVDDAIVVAEHVKRSMDENPQLSSREAAKKSMQELWGALIGTTVVIWAVFIPMAFFGGATGVIYRQFSITILASMTISLFIALSFSPSLAGAIMHRTTTKKRSFFFRGFNHFYDMSAKKYEKLSQWLLKKWVVGLALFALFLLATGFIFIRIPEAFLPDEDQGRVFTLVNGQPNTTFERMLETIKKVEDFYLKEAKGAVHSIFTVIGFSFSGRGQNAAIGFVNFKEDDKRTGEKTSVFDIAELARQRFSQIREALVIPITPPPISELGNASGFEFQLVDKGRLGRDSLIQAREKILELASKHPLLTNVRLNSLPDEPQYKIDIDYKKAKALGLTVQNINNTLSSAWGGMYVNDYIENNRVKRVFLQGETPYRMKPEDLSKWFVRNELGEMVSFSDFAAGVWSYGPPQLQRFNGFSSFEIQGEAHEGSSTGEAMNAILGLQKDLPKGIEIEWTGLSYEEQEAGTQVFALYAISIIAIFLSLAALYESWSIPFSIILVLPLGIFGASLFVWFANLTNDIYFKVGFLLIMGLAAKNAILIVEFAKIQLEQGKSAFEATLEACKQRFRPILMTSFTFILGVLPLALARGPGSGAQNAVGTSLLGGTLAITFLIIFFAPLFFYLIIQMKERLMRRKESKGE